ncbi:MAG: homocitrate synthase/isopropylmalate synthase family protein [Methanobacteriota archaeon]
MTRIRLLDSTLREGEQTAGVSYTLDERLEIASLLDEFHVDIIEAGHPVVSQDIRDGLRAVANEGFRAEVLAHARAMRSDIDAAAACDADWVGIFFCIADRALEQRFRTDFDAALVRIQDVVSYAKDEYGLKVRYTPEDTVRSDFQKVERAARVAIDAGADRISIADTTGCMTPTTMRDFVTRLLPITGPRLNVHCHNDLGLAVANAIAAVEAGVDTVDVCANGIGERAGITDLAQFATAARLHLDREAPWRLELLPAISRRVAQITGIRPAANAPVGGANAFTHNAGLHVSAVLIDPGHYESIPAEVVGRSREICIDKFSGREGLRFELSRVGYRPSEDALDRILAAIKTGAKKRYYADDLLAIMAQTELCGSRVEGGRQTETVGSLPSTFDLPPSTPVRRRA